MTPNPSKNVLDRTLERLRADGALSEADVAPTAPIFDMLPDRAPMTLARDYLLHRYPERQIRFWRGDFYAFGGNKYDVIPLEEMRADVWRHLDRSSYATEKGSSAVKPSGRMVSDVIDALTAPEWMLIPSDAESPHWIVKNDLPASAFTAMRNGLLHRPTRTLYPHTPTFFNTAVLDFDYNPDAPKPEALFEFTMSLWGDNREPERLLAEWFGYCITPSMVFQKILMMVGPPRSGKGTMSRLLSALAGSQNCAAPTMSGLATQFGLQCIIGKPLAIIADARISGRSDSAVITERLLSLSGGDRQSIPRKHRPDWEGTPSTKFVLLANDLPRLPDASSAFAGRLLLLTTTKSFLDAEDHNLEEKLLAELPSIFNLGARRPRSPHRHRPVHRAGIQP